jgi:hypothetical protein
MGESKKEEEEAEERAIVELLRAIVELLKRVGAGSEYQWVSECVVTGTLQVTRAQNTKQGDLMTGVGCLPASINNASV